VPPSSVSLDRVVRSVSVSEQSDESGTYPSSRRPPSPPNPRPDSRPGTRHKSWNPANHRPSAPGPHRGSRGTYGVVPRPEGPGEDGVLPGKQGVSGGRSPPLMHEQSAPSQPQPRTPVSFRWSAQLMRVRDPGTSRRRAPGPLRVHQRGTAPSGRLPRRLPCASRPAPCSPEHPRAFIVPRHVLPQRCPLRLALRPPARKENTTPTESMA